MTEMSVGNTTEHSEDDGNSDEYLFRLGISTDTPPADTEQISPAWRRQELIDDLLGMYNIRVDPSADFSDATSIAYTSNHQATVVQPDFGDDLTIDMTEKMKELYSSYIKNDYHTI